MPGGIGCGDLKIERKFAQVARVGNRLQASVEVKLGEIDFIFDDGLLLLTILISLGAKVITAAIAELLGTRLALLQRLRDRAPVAPETESSELRAGYPFLPNTSSHNCQRPRQAIAWLFRGRWCEWDCWSSVSPEADGWMLQSWGCLQWLRMMVQSKVFSEKETRDKEQSVTEGYKHLF